jgi:hypothetical protein
MLCGGLSRILHVSICRVSKMKTCERALPYNFKLFVLLVLLFIPLCHCCVDEAQKCYATLASMVLRLGYLYLKPVGLTITPFFYIQTL